MIPNERNVTMSLHFCLTATSGGNVPGEQFTVHLGGGSNIRDAIKVTEKAARKRVSHGRGCSCGNPSATHAGNTVIRDGQVFSADLEQTH